MRVLAGSWILIAVMLAVPVAMALEAEGPLDPPVERTGVVGAVLGQLEDVSDRPRELSQSDWEALQAFYEQPGVKPIWTDSKGPLQAARDAAAEIGRADEFGLSSEAFSVPALDASDWTVDRLGAVELGLSQAVLLYARHARGARVDPAKVGHQLQQAPKLLDPAAVLQSVADAADTAAYLRSLHPKHPQFEALRKKLTELRSAAGDRSRTKIPDGPSLRMGARHKHVALLRKRLSVATNAAPAGNKRVDENLFDAAMQDAVKKFQRDNSLTADGVVGPGTRRALNGDSNDVQTLKIVLNMERWRWLPDDLDGEAGIYVWANIPEFRVRVVREGKTVFSERVIVGKLDKQTPVFSDMMEWIEFHPTWYVPNSIKVEDILPSLRRPTSRVMSRYHLQLNCGRHGRDPKAIDWNSVDIRKCSISQPPGQKSVLGDFKFKFPNKHAVYMHDTPTKRLFGSATRTFSHGCVRIQNPRRMAEILLEHDKKMKAERIAEILAGPKRLHKEELNRHVPVHITYFTAVFDDDGKFVTRPDFYGHDRRLAQVLMGKGNMIPVPAVAVRSSRKKKRRPQTRTGNWWQPHFMQN